MKIFTIVKGSTGFDGLKRGERERPTAGPGHVLVRMRAASLNFRDLAILAGKYFRGPLTQDTIPLSDGAGEVAAVGAGVTQFAVGDRVVATFTQGNPPAGARLSARRDFGRVRCVPCRRSIAAAAAPVVRGGRDAAVRRGDGLECADARPAQPEARRNGARARYRRRGDFRAADREDGRCSGDHHFLERCQARARARSRRRSLHQLQDHSRVGEEPCWS